jgi:hypothetical protein
MDPLSIVAGIAGVADLAGRLADICRVYTKRPDSANKNIETMSEELDNLLTVLNNPVETLAESGYGISIASPEISSRATECAAFLIKINDKIRPNSTQSSTRKLDSRYQEWPLQPSETEEVVHGLKLHTSLLAGAMQIEPP